MDTVLHHLRLRHLVAPDAQPSFWWLEGDRMVRGLLGSGWAYGIAQDCCPEVGDAMGIDTVKTDIAEARCRHRVPFFCPRFRATHDMKCSGATPALT